MKKRTKVVVGALALYGAAGPVLRAALHLPTVREHVLPLVVKPNWTDEQVAVMAQRLERQYGYNRAHAVTYLTHLRGQAQRKAEAASGG